MQNHNHVLQVLPTTSLVYIIFPYSGPAPAVLFTLWLSCRIEYVKTIRNDSKALLIVR